MTTALPTSRTLQRGFTFIEVLTVTVLIAVISMIAIVGYRGSAETTRDARRKKELGQLQLAVESYNQVNGEYPDHGAGCSTVAYPGCQSSGDWIIGVVPDFMASLPTDPKQAGGSDLDDPEQYSYQYEKTATGYYLRAKLENENDDEANQDGIYEITEIQ